MLAEKRTKQRWSLNPRGKHWSEDSNKFGQKLLEKMGWSHGKGLGAKEDGIKEHIKISHKNDSKGIGYKESNDQWTEHHSQFNTLLQSLSGQSATDTNISLSSLEVKSQSAKKHIHYKKFARGKDLSQRSEKDLANIFGKKSLSGTIKSTKEYEKEPEVVEEKAESANFTYNKISIVDYFKKKLPNFGQSNGYVVGNNGVLKKADESEEEHYFGFGFKTEDKGNGQESQIESNFVSYIQEEVSSDKVMDEETTSKRKSKKKRKLDREVVDNTPTKKIKRVETSENFGVTNLAFDPLHSSVKIEKHNLSIIDENGPEEMTDNVGIEMTDNVGIDITLEKEKSPEQHKLKKKNKKSKADRLQETGSGISNPSFDVNRGEHQNQNEQSETGVIKFESTNHTSNEVLRKKKKKKTKKDDFDISSTTIAVVNNTHMREVKKVETSENLGVANLAFDALYSISIDEKETENSLDNENTSVQSKSKKKSKANRLQETITGISNPSFALNGGECQNKDEQSESSVTKFETVYNTSDYEVFRKKKKKAMKDDQESVYCASVTKSNDISLTTNTSEFEVKRKKAKKTLAIENPNFDDALDDGDPSSSCNFQFEVKRKKKKNKQTLAVDNPNFNQSLEEVSETNISVSTFEIKRTKNKKCPLLAIDNPSFTDAIDVNISGTETQSREQPTNDNLQLDNTNLNLSSVENQPDEGCDLMLNVVSTPILPKTNTSLVSSLGNKKSSLKRRKSVRFSQVNEQRIIPRIEDLEIKNELFDINNQVITSNLNVDSISKKMDGLQAEIENDMNEAKLSMCIGEIGDPHGENEQLPNGVRLKLKYATFDKLPHYAKRTKSGPKASYRHLIRGDLILGFMSTNLHNIDGYGINKGN